MNRTHVCWLHHSRVYHRAHYYGLRDGRVQAPCGTVVFSPLFRCQEGRETEAETLGLRRCRRCWKATTAAVIV